MLHEIHSIKSFRITAPHTIEIIFEDNSHKTINFLPVLMGEMYGPLKNPDYFKKASLDIGVNTRRYDQIVHAKLPNIVHQTSYIVHMTIVWPNGADFDPALLYNWDQHIAELSRRAVEWKSQHTNVISNQ